jgi:kynurenine formamidase
MTGRSVAGLAASLALGAAGLATGEGPLVDLTRARLLDLTHPFDERTLYWPTATSGFRLETVHRGRVPEGYFYSAYSLCAPEHGGTHLDAPVHFAEGAQAADEVPLEKLIAPAVVLDVSARAAAAPGYLLAVSDVQAWEKTHGRLPGKAVVLVRTGWGSRWPDRKRYLGDDTPGDASRLHFPGLSKEAAQLLVARGAAAVGIDTASIDHGPSRDFAAHRVLGPANVPAFENLANLEGLPPTGAWVIALPMKIRGGSGGPLRIVALVPR